MAPSTFNTSQQKHLLSIALCKYSSVNTLSFDCLSHFLTFPPFKHKPFSVLRAQAHVNDIKTTISTTTHENPTKTKNLRMRRKENGSGQPVNNLVNSIVEKIEKRSIKDRNTRKDMNFRRSKNIGPRNSSTRHKDGNKERKPLEDNDISVAHGKMERKTKKGGDNQVKEEKIAKGSKRNKPDSPEIQFRIKLDMCSKKGDVMGAIQLYDLGQKEGIKMEQYHYTVLLYLCSSAAVGIVQPAKSGSGGRVLTAEVSSGDNSLRKVELSELRDKSDRGATESESLQLDQKGYNSENHDAREIQVSEDIKKYALERGFEIYEKMCMDKVPMNEATLTAVARMAMSMGNADMAFDMVKQMKPLGLNPRLRSYGPALYAFCNNGDVDKAFAVEKHMLEHGVYPEEPELEALLKVSVQAGKGDKVYYILHKLRTSVRKVSPSTAEIIVGWFKSKAASRVGKTKWDKRVIEKAIENGGGGWHGQGWLGKGKWTVSVTSVGSDASCKSCGEKLVTIDLDPIETDNFAESVASIAIKRDKDSSFQKFQKWLDYYGPFEAVIDGANVGLLSQKRFVPSKINAIANGIRQKLPSKRWPLIVLHNRRITGPKMDEPVNKALVEKWKNADALYATPTGSNDDWYWLYAAIKFRCLIVTNDEMRDHTFQLLGNDFFPKWKERHQVHFNFSEAGPIFHMPPCFSVVIQESEKGHWHIPIATDHDYEPERAWLCITRAKSFVTTQDSTPTRHEDSQSVEQSNGQSRVKLNQDTLKHSSQEDLQKSPQEVYKNLTNILSASGFSDHNTVLSKIEAAEKFGDCVIDFQI